MALANADLLGFWFASLVNQGYISAISCPGPMMPPIQVSSFGLPVGYVL